MTTPTFSGAFDPRDVCEVCGRHSRPGDLAYVLVPDTDREVLACVDCIRLMYDLPSEGER